MVPCYTMSPRVHFLIHSRRSNWNCSIQLITWYCPSWHILCCSPFPLCIIYRSSIRYHSWLCSLIPTIFRIYLRRHMSKSSLRYYIRRRQPNIFPSTFLRFIRNTSPLLRLPRCLYYMKYSLIYRLIHLTHSCSCNNLHNLRSLRIKTRSPVSFLLFNKPRMTSRMSSTLPYIRRAFLRES